jgi:hypothetical protein
MTPIGTWSSPWEMLMKSRLILVLAAVMCAASLLRGQIETHTSESGGEALRQIRNNKLDLILPGSDARQQGGHVDSCHA